MDRSPSFSGRRALRAAAAVAVRFGEALPVLPPSTAAPRLVSASQKSRSASIAALVAAMRWRASVSSAKTSICIAL